MDLFGNTITLELPLMDAVSSKAEVRKINAELWEIWKAGNKEEFLNALHHNLLLKKVRFPLLEFAAEGLLLMIEKEEQVALLDAIIARGSMGGNVIAGKMLQLRFHKHPTGSIGKAVEYIIAGNEWYVCDIIGERVMGHALLTHPESMMPMMKKLARHPNNWIVRSVGVGIHYAVKNGLPEKYVEDAFILLMSLNGATDLHIKKGIGWAAKTISKFHPEIIEKHREQLEADQEIGKWFKTKIAVGLSRKEKYAGKNEAKVKLQKGKKKSEVLI